MDSFEQEIRNLIAQGKRIQAVQYVTKEKGLGLKEAKEYVDALARESPVPFTAGVGISKETLEFEVRELLVRNRKIEAVKKARELTGWGLREAKDFVDAMEKSQF